MLQLKRRLKIAQLIRYSDQPWFLIDCQQRCQTSKRQVGEKITSAINRKLPLVEAFKNDKNKIMWFKNVFF